MVQNGGHTKWLLDYVKKSKTFDIESYKQVWLKNIKNYKGYIDGACQETMQIIQNDATTVVGSSSHDLSILGRIAPLLYVSGTKEAFLSNVKSFVSFTHNNKNVLHVSKLFASILYDVVNGSSIKDALSTVTVVKESGDSSSRGMIVAMLMGAEGCSIPPSWRKATKGV